VSIHSEPGITPARLATQVQRYDRSLLRLGVAQRLLIAAVPCVILWLIVGWVLA